MKPMIQIFKNHLPRLPSPALSSIWAFSILIRAFLGDCVSPSSSGGNSSQTIISPFSAISWSLSINSALVTARSSFSLTDSLFSWSWSRHFSRCSLFNWECSSSNSSNLESKPTSFKGLAQLICVTVKFPGSNNKLTQIVLLQILVYEQL